MIKREAKSLRKVGLLMELEDNKTYEVLCAPLSESPVKSPNLKKQCTSIEKEVSNADISNAVKDITSCFVTLEQMITKNTSDTV